MYRSIDSLYSDLLRNAESRYGKGDFSQLDLLNIKARQHQAKLNFKGTGYSIQNFLQKLKTLMNYEEDFVVTGNIEMIVADEMDIESYPAIQLLKLQNNYAEALLKIEKNKMLPDLSLNYFTGTDKHENSRYYNGFQVGVAVPLFFGSQRSRIRSSKISIDARQLLTDYEINSLKNKIATFKREELKLREAIEYYNSTGRLLYEEILGTALKSFESGEIDLFKFTSSYENAVQIKLEYLDNVLQYNTNILEQMYLSN
jgi:heavy metal efflux system protein